MPSLIRSKQPVRSLAASLPATLLSACGGKIGIGLVDSRARLSMNACPVLITFARCGQLTVPENREQANSRLIGLPYVRLPAREAGRSADPVPVLGGGPGSSVPLAPTAAPAESLSLHPRRQGRDINALDYRGTPLTGPGSLDCQEPLRDYAASKSFLPDADLMSAVSACKTRKLSLGADLGADDNRRGAYDLEELRHLLGERRGLWQWNNVTTSYCTRLAFASLQESSDSEHSLVLDGPLIPKSKALYSSSVLDAVHDLLSACIAQPARNAPYPGERQRFAQAMLNSGACTAQTHLARTTVANAYHQRAYFHATPVQSDATGRAVIETGSGLKRLGLVRGRDYKGDDRHHLSCGSTVASLQSDARRSPLARRRIAPRALFSRAYSLESVCKAERHG